MSFTFKNQDKFIKELEAGLKKKTTAAGRALYQVGCMIMEDAKANAPVDTSLMRESGYVELPTMSMGRWKLELGFGGPAGQYVIEQHEDTSLNHRVGGPKFLTNAMNKYSSNFVEIMRQLMDENEGSGASILQNAKFKTNPWQAPSFSPGVKE